MDRVDYIKRIFIIKGLFFYMERKIDDVYMDINYLFRFFGDGMWLFSVFFCNKEGIVLLKKNIKNLRWFFRF